MSQSPTLRPLTGDTTEAVLAELPPLGLAFLYKHSYRCGISLTAREEVEAFAISRPDVPIYQLDVLAQRPLSQALAALLHVPHASPQVILLRDRVAVWSASHSRITVPALTAALADRPGGSTDRRASRTDRFRYP